MSQTWGKLDFSLHAIAFAPKEDLHGRHADCSRDGFLQAMDICRQEVSAQRQSWLLFPMAFTRCRGCSAARSSFAIGPEHPDRVSCNHRSSSVGILQTETPARCR
jgi:hypothetical protein